MSDTDRNGTVDIADAVIALQISAEARDPGPYVQLDDAVRALGILSGLTYPGPGDCKTSDEAVLGQLINDYRAENAKPAVSVSKSLSEVARWHVIDLVENRPDLPADCNMHSWSDWSGQAQWTSMCYTSDHANAANMWSKPSEITDGVYSATGFEIAFFMSSGATPEAALEAWKNSAAHDDVILENGIWSSYSWSAMGVGVHRQYAVVWFGTLADPSGTIPQCP